MAEQMEQEGQPAHAAVEGGAEGDGTQDGGLSRMDDALGRYGPYVALAIAWIAMVGSLYFSEVLAYKPCRLCWYQRIFMYPLAAIIAVGLLKRDRDLRWYALPLTLVGLGISGYHVLLQKTSWFYDGCRVGAEVPCSFAYINWLGFITIPVLAFTAFLLILLTVTPRWPDDAAEAKGLAWGPVLGVIGAVLAAFALLYLLR